MPTQNTEFYSPQIAVSINITTHQIVGYSATLGSWSIQNNVTITNDYGGENNDQLFIGTNVALLVQPSQKKVYAYSSINGEWTTQSFSLYPETDRYLVKGNIAFIVRPGRQTIYAYSALTGEWYSQKTAGISTADISVIGTNVALLVQPESGQIWACGAFSGGIQPKSSNLVGINENYIKIGTNMAVIVSPTGKTVDAFSGITGQWSPTLSQTAIGNPGVTFQVKVGDNAALLVQAGAGSMYNTIAGYSAITGTWQPYPAGYDLNGGDSCAVAGSVAIVEKGKTVLAYSAATAQWAELEGRYFENIGNQYNIQSVNVLN